MHKYESLKMADRQTLWSDAVGGGDDNKTTLPSNDIDTSSIRYKWYSHFYLVVCDIRKLTFLYYISKIDFEHCKMFFKHFNKKIVTCLNY